jgi:hypothetical protein
MAQPSACGFVLAGDTTASTIHGRSTGRYKSKVTHRIAIESSLAMAKRADYETVLKFPL